MDILDEVSTHTEEVKPEKAWSPFQVVVFDEVQKPEQDLLIQAVAGSGKTTTIIKAMEYAPGSSLFMAFNKAIAEDIRTKADSGDVKTLNALGHGLVMGNQGGKLNARKALEAVKKIMGDTEDCREYAYTLSRVIGLAKNNGVGLDCDPSQTDFTSLIDAYAFDIPEDKLEMASAVCQASFQATIQDTSQFDFDDQLYLPVLNAWRFPNYSNVFIDEAQDLSPIQHRMAQCLKNEGARLVAVGDRHQAIYGFRGASHSSMDELAFMFQMKELPLSICYRCPQEVVLAAQQFCPQIVWREGAPQGRLIYNTSDPERFGDHQMILCRNNAPLFREILGCIRRREPCQVRSNFLDSFQSFIRSFKSRFTSDLEAKLDNWFEKEREVCLAKGKRGKLFAIKDRYDTIKLLCREYKQTEDMIYAVKCLGESKRGPIFSTIHKAKGLEHPSVYILRPDLFGLFAETEEQKRQEGNLHYVAITRSQDILTYGAGL